jgi:hypothetical protein
MSRKLAFSPVVIWRAVVIRALHDLAPRMHLARAPQSQAGRESLSNEAREWLLSAEDDQSFRKVCSWAGLSPDDIRGEAMRRLKSRREAK